jgi:hypothetical protein
MKKLQDLPSNKKRVKYFLHNIESSMQNQMQLVIIPKTIKSTQINITKMKHLLVITFNKQINLMNQVQLWERIQKIGNIFKDLIIVAMITNKIYRFRDIKINIKFNNIIVVIALKAMWGPIAQCKLIKKLWTKQG